MIAEGKFPGDLAGRFSAWLKRAGVRQGDTRASLAVGLSDFLDASRHTQAHIEAMLAEDPIDPEGADRALEYAAHIGILLFSEAKDHLLELEALWKKEVEERLAGRGAPEPPWVD